MLLGKIFDTMISNIVYFSTLIVLLLGYSTNASGFSITTMNSSPSEELNKLRSVIIQNPDSVIYVLNSEYAESDDLQVVINVNYLMGLAYYFKGNYLVSNYYYDLIIDSSLQEESIRFLEAAYNNKGVNLELLGLYEYATDMYIRSKAIAKNRGDLLSVGQSILNLGVLFSKLGDKKKSLELTEEALNLFEAVDDSYHIALAMMNIGAYLSVSSTKESSEKLESALILFQSLGAEYRVAETLYHQALILYGEEAYSEALIKASLSIELQPDIDFNSLKINTLSIIIGSYLKLDRSVEALAWIREVNSVVDQGLFSGYSAMEGFWGNSEVIFSKLQLNEDLSIQNEIKKNLKIRIDSVRNDKIAKQYEKLSKISTAYADSVLLAYGQTGDGDEKYLGILFGSGIFIALVIGLLYWFYVRKEFSKQEYYELEVVSKLARQLQADNYGRPEPSEIDSGQSVEMRELFQRIQVIVVENSLYKEHNISRKNLAKELHTNTKYISRAIKQETGMSFTDYINSCAVTEAIKLMKSENFALSNEEMAEKCGFNSVSSYYRGFKKVTGFTPKAFQDRLQLSNELSKYKT